MSLGRRILLFPLTLLLIAAVLLAGSAFAIFAVLGALKLPIGPLLTEAILAGCALLTLVVVGRLIERRTFAELGFGRGLLRDMGIGLALGAGIISLVIGLLALFGWYQVVGSGALVGAGIVTNLSVILLFLLVAVFEGRAARERDLFWRRASGQSRRDARLVHCHRDRGWRAARRDLHGDTQPVDGDRRPLGLELFRGARLWNAGLRQ